MLGDITLLMSAFRLWLFCISMLSITVRLPNYDQVITQIGGSGRKGIYKLLSQLWAGKAVGVLGCSWCEGIAAQELLLCKSSTSLDQNPNQISVIQCNDGEAATLRSLFPNKCKKIMVMVCLHQLKTDVKESLYVTDAKGDPITA